MRLIRTFSESLEPPLLTKPYIKNLPQYAVLSHTWGRDEDEVNFGDIQNHSGSSKLGFEKIRFCNSIAKKDKLSHFWVDTCCIDKTNNVELAEAITSMFRWYHNASKCYVYLADVSVTSNVSDQALWEDSFRKSRWFSRGWTLQELLAPPVVEFYSKEWTYLGDKSTLETAIHERTGIPVAALRGTSVSQFSIDERFQWAAHRVTTKEEDQAYCLLGLFGVFMPLIYGEGQNAFVRLREEVQKSLLRSQANKFPCNVVFRHRQSDFIARSDIQGDAEKFLLRTNVNPVTNVLLLYGLPGSGKTRIAHEIAQNWVQSGKAAYWMDASSPETLGEGLHRFASSIDFQSSISIAKVSRDTTQEKVFQFLQNSAQPWLLVLDNHDVYDKLTSFSLTGVFPEMSQGSVVITSRNGGLSQVYRAIDKVINVQQMQPKEAETLFRQASHIPEVDQSPAFQKSIAFIALDLMGSLPLAIAQAGSYIWQLIRDGEDVDDVLERYIADYISHRNSILQENDDVFIEQYGQSVITLFEMAFKVVEKKNETACRLLLLFAFFHHSEISMRWFEQASLSCERFEMSGIDLNSVAFSWFARLIRPGHNAKWSPSVLRRSLTLLSNYGLLTIKGNFVSVDVHPLIHSWCLIFLQQQRPEYLNHTATLAAAVLCEVYNRKADPSNARYRLVQAELLPHVESWYSCTSEQTALFTHPYTSKLQAYTLNRMSEYLSSFSLHHKHKAVDIVVRLQILAFTSDLVQQKLWTRFSLWAFRKIVAWLNNDSVMSRELMSQTYLMIDKAVDQLVLSGDTVLNPSTARAETLTERMFAEFKSASPESVATAKHGIQFLLDHPQDIEMEEQAELLSRFYCQIACFDADTQSRLDHLAKLEASYQEVVELLGHDNMTAMRALGRLRSAQQLNDKVPHDFPDGGANLDAWEEGGLFREMSTTFIQQRIGQVWRENTKPSSDKLRDLLEKQHAALVATLGEWHPESLEKELTFLNNLAQSDRLLSAQGRKYLGVLRWTTRNEALATAGEVAIGLKVLNRPDRAHQLWTGCQQHWRLRAQSAALLDKCADILLRTSKFFEDQKRVDEAEWMKAISDHIKGQMLHDQYNNGRIINAMMLDMYRMWQRLMLFEESLASDPANTEIVISSEVLSHMHEKQSVLQESILYLLLRFLQYLYEREAYFFHRIMTLRLLDQIGSIFHKTFGAIHPLNFRWKVFEAICLRLHGKSQEATKVDEFLVEQSVPTSNRPTCEICLEGTAAFNLKQPFAKNHLNTSMKGEWIIWIAEISLEKLAFQYRKRQWYRAEANLHRLKLLSQLHKLGLHSREIADNLLSACYAFGKDNDWTGLWALLQHLDDDGNNPKYSEAEVEKIVENLLEVVARGLLAARLSRTLVLLLDWLRDSLELPGPASSDTPLAKLLVLWHCATRQRLAYARLGYPVNVEACKDEVENLEMWMDGKLDVWGEDLEAKVRQLLHDERKFWLRVNDKGEHVPPSETKKS